jgi:hypothetical protein
LATCSFRRALGAAPLTLDGMRALLRRSGLELRSYSPSGGTRAWEAAASRVVLA